jgi:phosphoribosyl-dephospho-CoA transferase
MNTTFCAHDLLWGMTPDQLPAEAPDWARQVLIDGLPVVVRRATGDAGSVPVGVRGNHRAQRLAAWMARDAVQCRRRPEDLRPCASAETPALAALGAVTPILDDLDLPWGPTGATAYQLATGLTVLHQASDLDLVVRSTAFFSREHARALQLALSHVPCRIDLQLETPNGAVALAEWAAGTRRVLLKHCDGARLVANPWCLVEQPA